MEIRFKKLRTTQKVLAKKLFSCKGVVDLLKKLGFELIDETYSFEGCENELFSLLKAIESISNENKKL